MAAKQSQQVTKALRLFARTNDVYASARKHQIAPSTLYRAIKRTIPPAQDTSLPAPFPEQSAGSFIRYDPDLAIAEMERNTDLSIEAEAGKMGLVRMTDETNEALCKRIEDLRKMRGM